MKMILRVATSLAAIFLVFSAGCQAGSDERTPLALPSAPVAVTFSPYYPIHPSRSVVRPTVIPLTVTPQPSVTPTPRTHEVKAGEDMSGIALRYRVPLSELKTANPSVIPRLMKVGAILIIPGTALAAGAGVLPTATPRPIEIGTAACDMDSQGGCWCFFLVSNQSSLPMINVTLQLHLADAGGKQIAKQQAALPLDLLKAGAAMPLQVHFPPPLPPDYQVTAQLVSALPASAANTRYPAIQVSNIQTIIAEDRLSALITGNVELPAGQADAGQVSLLAIAYDDADKPVGLRRWDASQPFQAGQALPFRFYIYSTGRLIQRVELMAEARK